MKRGPVYGMTVFVAQRLSGGGEVTKVVRTIVKERLTLTVKCQHGVEDDEQTQCSDTDR